MSNFGKKTGVMHACDHCGKEHYVYRCKIGITKFCSKSCYDAAQTTSERRKISCECCGNEFVAAQDHGKWPKFCSVACRDHGAIKPEYRKCGNCESEFLATRSSHKAGDGLRIYCSRKCANEGLRNGSVRNCVSCGQEFYINQATARQRKDESCCSPECQNEFYIANQSPAWKGGRYFDATVGCWMVYRGRKGAPREYIAEYRIIASQIIGRALLSDERVIHINNIKSDDRPENLFICGSNSEMRRRWSGSLPFPDKSNLNTYK